MLKLAIVGAGWAGMAAAVRLAEAGWDVTVYEAARTLGGRARALPARHPDGTPLTLDNGQHILIGAYRQALALMRQVGLDPREQLLALPLALPYPDGSGLRTPAWAVRWPAPLDALAAIASARGWRWRERLALVRASLAWQRQGFRCDPSLSVAALGERLPDRVMRELLEPLCVSALNVPVHEASAQVFLRVLQDALFGQGAEGFGPSNLLLPRTDLSRLFPQAAADWLARHHGARTRVLAGHRVTGLSIDGDRWRLQVQGMAPTTYDRVIWATGAGPAAQAMAEMAHPPAAAAAWTRTAQGLRFTAITTVYAWADGARLAAPLLALRTGPDAQATPAQFVFDRGQLSPGDPAAQGLLAFVASASQGEREDLQARVLQQAARQLGLHALQPVQTVVEKRATFACVPGVQRPPPAIAPGLWAAGDYVQGPYPATLEGAVCSGVAAAALAADAPVPRNL